MFVSQAMAQEAEPAAPVPDVDIQTALIQLIKDPGSLSADTVTVVVDTGLTLMQSLLGALFIFVLFWILGWVLGRAVRRACRRLREDQLPLVHLLRQVVTVTLRVFGAVMALGTLGIDVTALVAGLGLTTFGLGMALKDVVSNALSGVLVLLNRPFRIGDTIQIGGDTGRVERIDLRYTVLIAEDRTILVPNGNLFSSPVRVLQPGTATAG